MMKLYQWSMVIHSSDGHQYLSGSSELTKDNSYIGSSLVKNIFYPFKFSRICDIWPILDYLPFNLTTTEMRVLYETHQWLATPCSHNHHQLLQIILRRSFVSKCKLFDDTVTHNCWECEYFLVHFIKRFVLGDLNYWTGSIIAWLVFSHITYRIDTLH